jgi:UDP-glucose 4-epimerase
VFASRPIEAVMHFAAYAYVGESVTDPAKYYNNNLAGSLSLLEAMRKAGVNKFIFSSTCATYGVPQEIPITEVHPQAPVNPYGWTKLMIEQALADYQAAYGLQSVILRYFNAAGADPGGRIGERHIPETHLIPLAIEAAVDADRPLSVFGTDYDTPDGTCIRDYIHVTDLAQAHLLGLEHLMGKGKGGVFNLGNGSGFSVRDIIKCVEKVSGRQVHWNDAPRRAGDPPQLVGSSRKIKAELGWEPKHADIEEIVRTAYAWRTSKRF